MIYIYCNAGGQHGMGHVRRMQALAHALTHYISPRQICFLSQTVESVARLVVPFACEHIEDQYGVITAGGDIYIDDCKEPYFSDATIEVMSHHDTKTVAIDNPHAKYGWDMVVAPCNHWETKLVAWFQEHWGERFLYGWPYILIPPSVAVAKPIPYDERTYGHVLFYGGSGDTLNIVNRMAEWVESRSTRFPIVPVNRIYTHGAMSLYPHDGPGIHCWYSSDLLRQASLAVGPFGQTVYEAFYYKVPVFMLAHTEENYQGALRLVQESDHAVGLFGMIRTEESQDFSQEIFCRSIERFYQWREGEYMAAAMPDIDGDGARRVAEAILAL